MDEQATRNFDNSEKSRVVATSTLQKALRELRVPEQAVMILSGFRAWVPERDVLAAH